MVPFPSKNLLCRVLAAGVCLLALSGEAAAADDPELRSGVGMAGVGMYEPQHWGEVNATVENPSNQARTVLLLHHFDKAPHVQFGAEVWLPPKSAREILVPARASDPDMSGHLPSMKTTSYLVDPSGPTERRLSMKSGQVPVLTSQPVIAVLGESSKPQWDVLARVREPFLDSPSTLSPRRDALPTVPATYNTVDTLVVTSAIEQMGTAEMLALRQWLIGGGRIWIQAEAVDAAYIERLVGADWSLAVAGRSSRMQVELSWHDGGREKRAAVTTEAPVELLQVVPEGFEVMVRCGPWPALMRRDVGRGTIYVSTVGPAAWLEAANASEIAKVFKPLFEASPDRELVDTTDLGPVVAGQVGYEVLGRNLVIVVLGLFFVAFLMSGVGLLKADRLEHLGWIGIALAVVAALSLVVIGSVHRHQVPLTVASAQVARVVPEQEHAVISGLMSIYSPENMQGKIRAEKGGMVWSEVAGSQSGRPLRTIWTDIDRWHWENFDLPSGSPVNAAFYKSARLSDRVEATMKLGETSMAIDLKPGPFKELENLILAAPGGAIMVRGSVGSELTAGMNDLLPPGQYVTGGVLSDQQQRQQDVYRALMRQRDFPAQPCLLGWSRPMDLGLRLPGEAVKRDLALVIFPLALERPAPGESITVPGPLVKHDRARGPKGQVGMLAFNPVTREWLEVKNGGDVYLRLTLPADVGAIKPTGLELNLSIQARGWKVALKSYRDGKILDQVSDPAGSARLVADDPAALTPDGRGGYHMVLRVTSSGAGEPEPWEITRFLATVRGEVELTEALEEQTP
ncbi:MAG: hypothetical protein R3336_01020 [Phycisphaeraceae bacterium]|nr:hypothetical protein [Phycisphaeraceae bacterium]